VKFDSVHPVSTPSTYSVAVVERSTSGVAVISQTDQRRDHASVDTPRRAAESGAGLACWHFRDVTMASARRSRLAWIPYGSSPSVTSGRASANAIASTLGYSIPPMLMSGTSGSHLLAKRAVPNILIRPAVQLLSIALPFCGNGRSWSVSVRPSQSS
jgi:hypothetical protein